MKRSLASCCITFVMITLCVGSPRAAEPDDMLEFPTISFTAFSFAGVSQREADMDNGGKISITRTYASANYTRLASRTILYGVSLSYQRDDYDFSGPGTLPFTQPWGTVQQVMFTPSVIYSFAPQWLLYAAPLIGTAGETGADTGESLQYGAILSVSHRFSQELSIGLGAGIFQRIEDLRAFPVFAIRWQITDRLRLGNSLQVGPAGPAGLELAYALDENWETAIGGARRSLRFRLSETGPVPNGIGESKFATGNLRLSRKLGPHFKANLYVGSVRDGKLYIENRQGDPLLWTGYDKTPIIGLTVTGIF